MRVARQKSLDTKLSSNHPSEKSDRRKGLDFSPNIKRKRDRHVKSKETAASSSPRMSSDADSANTSVASGHPHGGKEKDRSRQRKSTTRQKVRHLIRFPWEESFTTISFHLELR